MLWTEGWAAQWTLRKLSRAWEVMAPTPFGAPEHASTAPLAHCLPQTHLVGVAFPSV